MLTLSSSLVTLLSSVFSLLNISTVKDSRFLPAPIASIAITETEAPSIAAIISFTLPPIDFVYRLE